MVAALHHRGPDGNGVWNTQVADYQLALGHTRLAILDLTEAGRQPMVHPESGCVLVYNGEIYNFAELRAELQAAGGAPFRSTGDTEVLLRAYLHWGPALVKKLRGMFAFGIYDPRRQQLFLARDHFGIKPLYFTERAGGYFAFASEVRALLELPWIRRKLDPMGLVSYLSFGSVQSPYTLVSGIYSLPPGHTLTIDFGTGRPEVGEPAAFWDLSEAILAPAEVSLEMAAAQIQHGLSESLRLHMVSDVPLGVFLSGGIDSSSLVALMAELEPSQVHTLTVSFKEAEYDESKIARAVAQRFGTKHTEIQLSPHSFLQDLPRWLESLDQPSCDGANTWLVSQACKKAGITVALSGLGGDELFGGYSLFQRVARADRLFQTIAWWPQSVRSLLAQTITALGGKSIATQKLSEWLRSNGSRLTSYLILRRIFLPDSCDKLLDPWVTSLAGKTALHPAINKQLLQFSRTRDPFTTVSLLEFNTYLLNTLLRDSDQMSMAHSLEIRVPFVDLAMVKLALPFLSNEKLREQPKQLLRSALGDKLDPAWVNRPKMTFSLPFDQWLRGPLKNEVQQELWRLADFPFQSGAVRDLWRRFLGGAQVNSGQILMLYALSHWMRRHGIEGTP